MASAPARIVNVASGAQQPIKFADVMLERGYGDGRAYAQSKLAQVMFTFDLARELEGTPQAAMISVASDASARIQRSFRRPTGSRRRRSRRGSVER